MKQGIVDFFNRTWPFNCVWFWDFLIWGGFAILVLLFISGALFVLTPFGAMFTGGLIFR